MVGFKAYHQYLAVISHFRDGSDYDYFKYNGRTNAGLDAFKKHKNKYNFGYFEKRYTHDFHRFLVANLVRNDFKLFIQQIVRNRKQCIRVYNEWCDDINNMHEVFKEEIFGLDIKSSVQCEKRKTPEIVKLLIRKQISFETFAIIYYYYDLKNVLQNNSDDIIIRSLSSRTDKYLSFLEKELNLETDNYYRTLL